MDTYTDDTAILALGNDPVLNYLHLQNHQNLIDSWSSKCRIKINHEKSIHENFTLKKAEYSPITFSRNPCSHLFESKIPEH